MSVHWGGRGPGHLSRLAKAVGAVTITDVSNLIDGSGASYDLQTALIDGSGASFTLQPTLIDGAGASYTLA